LDLAVGLSAKLNGAAVPLLNYAAITANEADAFKAALRRRTTFGGAAVVGSLDTDEREVVAKFILRHQIPCLLEATSGLRGDPRFSLLELKAGDRDLQKWIRAGRLAQVFRFGGVPTTRVWRDLDEPSTSTQTYSISKLRFGGLGRGEHFAAGAMNGMARLQALLDIDNILSDGDGTESEAELLLQDQASRGKLDKVLALAPNSEPSFVRALSEIIPDAACVYVGNSLPIRWWDWVASRKRSTTAIYANRGVNGIDGQISTALGIAAGSSCSELWIVVGDLTALYDLSGLWAAKILSGTKLRVVVINNSGGQIFRQVLKSSPSGSSPFENPHALKFKNWAAMWGFSYEHCADPARLSQQTFPDRLVLEIEPDSAATEEFWRTIE
jgi:2-succinyl-5-enolpyruvyl-6-hydroxy-3-cyclohexene-1-carboxylate synthase